MINNAKKGFNAEVLLEQAQSAAAALVIVRIIKFEPAAIQGVHDPLRSFGLVASPSCSSLVI
jgi:hypothetical protein